ncbi:shikimate kinase [Labilibaculum antarcticum]|uniref:Shikimate kinase n=1 Tax=Labilibaculum antarcticum TaxID=1717717 RepID=A0A1Y1CH21_9BACT|nr:shikimate kinase [Labilibaculum antarcticum]BAX79667.1 shikimate kinase [Labilibaculum antarcticum]
MKIFLIGYMGCGKSLWGKIVAEHYGFRFIDLDTLIEEREKLSVPEIFAKYDELGFREREHEALQSISDAGNFIVATGGGAPCFNKNMEEMNRRGTTLFIECSPQLLRDRITESDTERPLVKNFSQEELLNYIVSHLQHRIPFYEQSHYKLVSGNLELDDFTAILDPVINS